jgi:RimJ/RimL family protein N-acetyltransferase
MDSYIDKKRGIGIRPFSMNDAKAYHDAAIESAPVAYQYMPWCHPAYSLAESESWVHSQIELWKRGESFGFIVYEYETKRLIGAVEIARFVHAENCAEIGYWMRTSETGKGYSSAAAFLAARFAFEVLHLSYLRAYCLPENIASRRVVEKLGAKLIKEIPEFIFMHGKMRSAMYYELRPDCFLSPAGEGAA